MIHRPNRRRLAAAIALAVAVLVGMPFGPSRAQDGGKTEKPPAKTAGKNGKNEKKELTAAEKARKALFETIGSEFLRSDATALAARVAEDRKVHLSLGDRFNDAYAASNVKGALEGWFEPRRISKVKLKRMKGLVGTYDFSFRWATKDREVTKTLVVTLRKHEKDGATTHSLARVRVL